jgi:FkbM family methyltransferase
LKVIFDFGCNKGQNLDYFLANADKVIAIEAVPGFCETIQNRFASAIAKKKLVVYNVICGSAEFVRNTGPISQIWESIDHPGLSNIYQNPAQPGWLRHDVSVRRASDIVKEVVGSGHVLEFIKIDLEGADGMIIEDLLDNSLIPNFLSVEIHDANIAKEILNEEYFSKFPY